MRRMRRLAAHETDPCASASSVRAETIKFPECVTWLGLLDSTSGPQSPRQAAHDLMALYAQFRMSNRGQKMALTRPASRDAFVKPRHVSDIVSAL
jgi:hypothetical protein